MTTTPPDGGVPAWAPPDTPAEPPAPPQPPFPPAPARRRTNQFAIVAFVTGLVGLVPLAAGFAITALVQTGRRGEKGKGLATGGLAASVAWVAILAAAVTVTAGSSSSAERDESGQIRKSGRVPASELRQGDCFSGAVPKRTARVTAIPCAQPHDSEVIALSALPEEPYPGSMEVYLRAKELCANKGLYLQKSRHIENLDPRLLGPDERDWWDGNREVTCVVHYNGAGALTSRLAETIDPDKKYYHELKVGDCVDDLDEESPVTTTVPCTEPHRSQVYATYSLPLGAIYAPGDYPPYPGWEAVKKKAIRFCDKEARKVFEKHPPPVAIDEQYAAPTELNWTNGIRAVVCLARAAKGRLNRPLPPD